MRWALVGWIGIMILAISARVVHTCWGATRAGHDPSFLSQSSFLATDEPGVAPANTGFRGTAMGRVHTVLVVE
jgi:hypothetical protein